MHDRHRILAFAHVQKTGGMTVELVLRQSFGLRHLDVGEQGDRRYTARDLAGDLRRLPFLRSLAGHGLRPGADYGPHGGRLVWFAFVREPVARFLSHYQHVLEKKRHELSLEAFLRDPAQANRQVRFLAGREDLEAAKEVVRKRLCCVGRLERFDESLVLLRERSGFPGLRLVYGAPRNTARSRERGARIREEAARLHDAILERNQLDHALHQRIADEVYPSQVREYGEGRLARDVAQVFARAERSAGDRLRALQSTALRRAVHLPGRRADARRARRDGAGAPPAARRLPAASPIASR
jgi:hypothetical protein